MRKWPEVVKYFNSNVGKTLTLVDIEVDLNYLRSHILTRYKGMLRRMGYIKKVGKSYKVKKKFPENLTYTEAFKKYLGIKK